MVDHQAQAAAPERRLEQMATMAPGQAFKPAEKVGVDWVSHVASRPVP